MLKGNRRVVAARTLDGVGLVEVGVEPALEVVEGAGGDEEDLHVGGELDVMVFSDEKGGGLAFGEVFGNLPGYVGVPGFECCLVALEGGGHYLLADGANGENPLPVGVFVNEFGVFEGVELGG